MVLCPCSHRGEGGAFGLANRLGNGLRLPAVTMKRDHQPLSHAVGDFGTMVATHDMQVQIGPAARPWMN